MTVPLAAAATAAAPGRASARQPAVSGLATGNRITPEASAIEPVASAVRGFSADLFRALANAGETNDNLVCSPYSVAVALAMTRAGALGQTATEIDNVLHAPLPRPTALDAGFNALDQLTLAGYTGEGDGTKQPQLAVASSLWAHLDLALRAGFVDTLSGYYGAGVHRVDFRAVETARREINTWVSDNTRTRIPELLAPGSLAADAQLVLANAIYLKANWMFQFPKGATTTAPFTRADGRVVNVPMMSGMPDNYFYATGDGWTAVDLPYVGGNLGMAVVIPTSGSVASLEATLDGAWLDRLFRSFRIQCVQLKLPRWQFRVPVELRATLAALGMPTVFTPGADLSGMTSDRRLQVDKVVHETFISVDEKGTEAAAATGVIIRPPSIPVPVYVRADRPFLFVIYDNTRGVPLFIGRVADPSVTES